MYNLTDDPDETTDLGKDTEHAEIVTGMQRQMLNRFMDTHPDAMNLSEGLSIEEKLIWFCEPRDIGSEPGQK
ncbi:MAG: hypothetical protein AMS26_20245 [Bacteroides sp. SM23_62]|nr:MAG: hypothetical protein AMS26_20245 [Bacteroides sp. SM23_62]